MAKAADSRVPHVAILLATYNGMRFLPEQIASLIGQKGVTISIEAQDDGSTDGTSEYLDFLLKQNTIHKLLKSKNLGSSIVFMNLLRDANASDYYAFCDQDDIWELDKLEKLITLFSRSDLPEVAFSGRRVIDAGGAVLKIDKIDSRRIGIRNALIENSMPGNTMVTNQAGKSFIENLEYSGVKHYDSFIYLAFSAFGILHLSQDLLVRYRIHNDNQIGFGTNLLFKVGLLEKNLSIFKHNSQLLLASKTNPTLQQRKVILQDFIDLLDSGSLIKRNAILRRLNLVRKSHYETYLMRLYLLLR